MIHYHKVVCCVSSMMAEAEGRLTLGLTAQCAYDTPAGATCSMSFGIGLLGHVETLNSHKLRDSMPTGNPAVSLHPPACGDMLLDGETLSR